MAENGLGYGARHDRALARRLRAAAPAFVCALAFLLTVPNALRPAHAEFDDGAVTDRLDEKAEIFRRWVPLALRGDALAQFRLGRAYVTGRTEPEDFVEAARWLRKAATVGTMKNKRPQDWSTKEKWQAVVEAEGLCDEELGAFLRRKGLHRAHLERWRAAMQSALGSGTTSSTKRSPEARRVRELEKELRRKDKALAEASALLVLKKKAQAIWGDEDDDTIPRNGK